MLPIEIKDIRTALRLTQEELAIILGVTKTTVGRYEIGAAKPKGDAEKKLDLLKRATQDPEQNDVMVDIRESSGGLASMAAITALGAASALNPIAAAALGVTGAYGIVKLLKGDAGSGLFRALSKFHDNTPKD